VDDRPSGLGYDELSVLGTGAALLLRLLLARHCSVGKVALSRYGGVAQLVERLTGSQEVRGFESHRLHRNFAGQWLAGVTGAGRLADLTAKLTANAHWSPRSDNSDPEVGRRKWIQRRRPWASNSPRLGARNLASTVTSRIRASKARKEDQETIAELDQIVNDLLADKTELVRIAQAYQQELVAQRISAADIEYITTNLVPKLKELVAATANETDKKAAATEEMIDRIRPILSIESVTLLQMIGFNFRAAIGEPLTHLIARLISSAKSDNEELAPEIRRLELAREVAYLEVVRDPEAFARFAKFSGAAPQ